MVVILWVFLRELDNRAELFLAIQFVFCNLTLLGVGIIVVIKRESLGESQK